ncbi:MAG: NAD kinase [Bacteroidales bacterium]|nr:NAD kinase [Bacteroidales bacterium]
MKIAIFGREFKDDFNDSIYKIFETLNKNNVEIYVHEEYLNFINKELFFFPKITGTFNNSNQMPENLDLLISVGGDGTILESVSYALGANIPVIGINSGRLGFLAQVSKDTLSSAFVQLLKGDYQIEERTLLELNCQNNRFGDLNIALNELTIMRVNSSSMISINVYLNDEFLNTYWSDGLIIATPTGSTAYSLSAGGPIITPGSGNFVITPVSPHNLSVRPIVISDDSVLRLKADGRGRNFLASLDYKQACFAFSEELILKKSQKKLKLVKLNNDGFFTTLRNKLLWGMDKRN